MEGLQKLFQVKRILAMVLAVTLAVTSAPLTAQAAPEDIPVQTATNLEDTPTEEASTGDTPTEETPDGEVSEKGIRLEDPQAGDPSAEGTTGDEDAGTSGSVETTAAETTDPEQQDGNPAASSVEESATAAQDNAQQTAKAEIGLNNFTSLRDENITISGWDDEKQTATVTTTYNDGKDNPFGTVVTSLKGYVSIEGVDSEEATALKSQLKYTWKQKGADGSYADMPGASAPVNAGEYRLEISIAPAFVSADAKSIDFVIEKAKLYVKVDSATEKVNFAGKTVGDVKEAYFKALQIALSEGGSGRDSDRYLQFVTAADKNVVKVGAPLGEAMADTEILKKDGDYLVEIAPALKAEYAANYELIPYEHNIAITALKPVKLAVESNLEPGKNITYVYKKEAVKAPTDATAAADKKVTVKIIVDDETDKTTGEPKELPVVLTGDKANITGVWLDVNKEPLAEGKVPEDAGIYYYKLTYTDPDGVYGNAADCLVKVVIEPAKLAVRPVLADDKKEYQKNTALSALLKNVGYTLIERDDDGKYTTKTFEIPTEEKDTFWGVSYNQPGKPQYYEPVFRVEKRVTTTTTYTDTTKKADTNEGNWTEANGLDEASGETKDEAASNASQTVTRKVEYRVVFAGKKSLYMNGVASNAPADVVDINQQIDVNNANTNYDVDVTKEVMGGAANVVAITVSDSTKVTINTDNIKANIKDMTLNAEGVYTKEYNEKAPFADRSEYKKAKTDKAEADAAGSFTYEWYGYTMESKLNEKGEVVKDTAGNPVKEPVCNDIKIGTDNDYTLKTLANAKLPNGTNAEYCLKISYTDPTKTYTAAPAYLYFKIEGKRVKVKPKQEPKPKAYTGVTVGEFLDSIKETVEYDIVEVNADGTEGTDLTETLKGLDKQINEANENNHLYTLNWVVLKGDNLDDKKAKYTEVERYEVFEGGGIPYKLGAELTFRQSNNKEAEKYRLNYTNAYERPETDPIRHNWYHDPVAIEVGVMSDTKLKIDFHPEKLPAFETVYSGEEQFKVEDLITAGYITAAAENAPDTLLPIGSGENQVPLVFQWQWSKNNGDSWQELGEGIENPLNAGDYRLTVSFPGDEKYHKNSVTSGDEFVINPKELTIKVAGDKLKSDLITAGLDMLSIDESAKLVEADGLTVTGYIEADKEAFAEGTTAGTGLVKDAPAFRNKCNVVVWEKGKKDSHNPKGSKYKGYLRYGKEYDLGVDAAKIEEQNEETLKD